ncbi:baculoviral IAP repeat-containing protein 7-like [Ruditapes philippinarum]|uniref:baculoviral IAP repeat-containing protein 7-like n=1 Tax=Ruditapes philippinarum TaxID=129788 RepID=UPI00295BC67C|nr:baculoviral IAP repeat-containing protein 7-like [Ruditapes philippinarum]
MIGGRLFLALLIFSFIIASFSTPDCLKRANMEPGGMHRVFINRNLLLYSLIIVLMLAGTINSRCCMHKNVKISGLHSTDLKCFVFPDKYVEDILNDYNISKYGTALEMKCKDRYATLYQLRRSKKQTFMVLPLSLERYFTECEKNGNTEDLMKFEWARYRTFCTFPQSSPARPIRLAANGFYYCGHGEDDTVRCFSCKQVYHGFKEGDIASNIHSRISPNCAFLTGVDKSNVGIHTEEQTGNASGGSTEPEKDHQNGTRLQKQSEVLPDKNAQFSSRRQHKHPDYANYQHRLDTFSVWPCPEILEPSVLADAGYFYAGFGDCVRCFSCGGGLRNWEYGDGPWAEHERWFPQCLYLNERLKDRKGVAMETLNAAKEKTQPENTNLLSAKSDIITNENKAGSGISTADKAPKNVFEENERLKNQLTCKICMDNASNMVFIPCGHMISCETCAPHIRKCAICRKLIEGRVKAFMS